MIFRIRLSVTKKGFRVREKGMIASFVKPGPTRLIEIANVLDLFDETVQRLGRIQRKS
jgi:hypothetical protein